MAILFFQITQFFAERITNTAVVVICFLDKPIPFNPLWIFEYLSGIAGYQGIRIIFEKTFLFVHNLCFWKMATAQGYGVITEILIGVLSISFSQNVSIR